MLKSENRSCNANTKLQRDTPPHLHSWPRGKCNLTGLATEFGERLETKYRACETTGSATPWQLSRIAQLDQRTALPDQCLHSAEADVRPPRRKSGFDPYGHWIVASVDWPFSPAAVAKC